MVLIYLTTKMTPAELPVRESQALSGHLTVINQIMPWQLKNST
jgi:hypothetical protein